MSASLPRLGLEVDDLYLGEFDGWTRLGPGQLVQDLLQVWPPLYHRAPPPHWQEQSATHLVRSPILATATKIVWDFRSPVAGVSVAELVGYANWCWWGVTGSMFWRDLLRSMLAMESREALEADATLRLLSGHYVGWPYDESEG